MTDQISERTIDRWQQGKRQQATDRVAVEAPLEVREGGKPRLLLMRTPGHDLELVAGLLYAEGVFSQPVVRPGAEPNVVEVSGTGRWPERALYSSAACGVCGKTSIEQLALRARPVHSDVRATAAVILSLPGRLRAKQATFEETGGLHAAGLFDTGGQLLCVREDVGRHNAVDKVFGWALGQQRLPAEPTILCVSGRLSYEIVQKAIVCGVPLVAAVSAPSSLAIDLAERFQVTLCGFVRNDRFNIYSHATRVQP